MSIKNKISEQAEVTRVAIKITETLTPQFINLILNKIEKEFEKEGLDNSCAIYSVFRSISINMCAKIIYTAVKIDETDSKEEMDLFFTHIKQNLEMNLENNEPNFEEKIGVES